MIFKFTVEKCQKRKNNKIFVTYALEKPGEKKECGMGCPYNPYPDSPNLYNNFVFKKVPIHSLIFTFY